MYAIRSYYEALDLEQLLGRHGLVMREIESQPIGRDQRAFLLHVRAQHSPQRRMQQMGRRVMQHGGFPPRRVDVRLNSRTNAEHPLRDMAQVPKRAAELLRIPDDEPRARRYDLV